MNCSFQSEGSPCGVGRPGSGMLPLLACRRDVTSHLVSLGISGKRGQAKTGITESEFILNRAGLFGTVNEEEIRTMTICPKHRKDLASTEKAPLHLSIPQRTEKAAEPPNCKAYKRLYVSWNLSSVQCCSCSYQLVFHFPFCHSWFYTSLAFWPKGWKMRAKGNSQVSPFVAIFKLLVTAKLCQSVTYA